MSHSTGFRIAVVLVAISGIFVAGSHGAGQTSKDYYEQGRAALAANRYKDALPLLDKAIASGATDIRAWRERAMVKRRLGDLRGSLADYDRYVQLAPGDSWALSARSVAKWENNDLKGALTDANRALAMNPTEAIALDVRGITHERLGALEEAMADYSIALLVHPENAIAWSNRGYLRSGQGDRDGAIADFEQALRIDPQLPNAKKGLAAVKVQSGLPGPPPMPDEARPGGLPPPPPLDPPGAGRTAAADPTGSTWSVERREALVMEIVKGQTSVGEAAQKAGLGAAVVKQWYDAFLSAGRAALK